MTTARKIGSGAAGDIKETIENSVRAGQDTYVRNLEQSLALAKQQFEKASATFFKGFGEAQSFSQENAAAAIKAGTIVSKGFEEMSKAWVGFAQGAMEQSASAAKAVMTARSIREVVDLQSQYTKSALDSVLAEGSRFSEMGARVANEAFGPLNERVNATVEKLGRPLVA